jgi:predicted metal-dependent enzyme (double-stranded beta helix superfamily)
MTAGRREARSRDDLTEIEGPVRRLFERIAGPAAAEPPDLEAIGAAILELAADRDYWTSWVQRLGDAGGSLAIHAPASGPRLALVRRPEGEMSAVHDHGTWVVLSPIIGVERHRRYRVDRAAPSARPTLVELRALEAADVVTMLPPEDVHDHGHVSGQGRPANVLILTGDDQTRFTRNEWDLTTGRHRLLKPGESGRWLASETVPDA